MDEKIDLTRDLNELRECDWITLSGKRFQIKGALTWIHLCEIGVYSRAVWSLLLSTDRLPCSHAPLDLFPSDRRLCAWWRWNCAYALVTSFAACMAIFFLDSSGAGIQSGLLLLHLRTSLSFLFHYHSVFGLGTCSMHLGMSVILSIG